MPEPRSDTLIKGYVPSRHGQLHYVQTAAGPDKAPPVLMLHQSPRSWDEYRDVLPIVGAHRRAIAMDTLGFGASADPMGEVSIELFADCVEDLLDALRIDRVVLVGHHTGGVIALECAARSAERVTALVLSGMPYVDRARRERVRRSPAIDHVEISIDGSHLQELWNRRKPFYPADRPDLLARLVTDALRVIDRVEDGHLAVNRYCMENRIGSVAAPTLVLCGELDEYSLPDVPRLEVALHNVTTQVLPDTGVPSVDHRPEQFAAAVLGFLEELERSEA